MPEKPHDVHYFLPASLSNFLGGEPLLEALRYGKYADVETFLTKMGFQADMFREPDRKNPGLLYGALGGAIRNKAKSDKPEDREDYKILFTLIKGSIEACGKHDVSTVDLVHCCEMMMVDGDLWKHSYVKDNPKPPTTEAQRRAVRGWVLFVLLSYSEKAIAGKDPTAALPPDWSRCKAFADTLDGFAKELRPMWVAWYGDPPDELAKLEVLLVRAANICRQNATDLLNKVKKDNDPARLK